MKNLFLSILIFAALQSFGQSEGFKYSPKDTTATQCTATTQKGGQCKLKAIQDGNKCRIHSEDTPRCNAPRSNGQSCKMIVKAKGLKCHHHNGSARAPKEDSTATFYEPSK